jgi:hypothetical protein
MNRIKINSESLPLRCEICHQTDCFIPETNQCSRCNRVENEDKSDKGIFITTTKQRYFYGNAGLIIGVLIGAALGLLSEKIKIYVAKDFFLNFNTKNDSIFWVMLGLAFVGGIWGNILGEAINLFVKRVKRVKRIKKGRKG